VSPAAASAGLCAVCRHARVVGSRRGSRFWLCSRSRTDPQFPRYPALPVLRCAGHEAGPPLAGPAHGGEPVPAVEP
jgi:hypothetical protein